MLLRCLNNIQIIGACQTLFAGQDKIPDLPYFALLFLAHLKERVVDKGPTGTQFNHGLGAQGKERHRPRQLTSGTAHLHRADQLNCVGHLLDFFHAVYSFFKIVKLFHRPLDQAAIVP